MSKERPFVPKTPLDFQKLKLEKLMSNPNKPVIIPDTPKEKKSLSVPDFVRNVMGSSAGAGSGEFHVYRHLRRKEYTRQKIIEEQAEREKLDVEFERKIEENKRKMEEKVAKNRAKRLKRKERRKNIKNLKKAKGTEDKKESDDNSSSEESNESPDADEENEGLDDEKSSKEGEKVTSDSEPLPEKGASTDKT